ncbi:hypothetical protein DdX_09138 [Ditylenchus destructor]|uniref:Uncharacterized protein n=1 Tax=Ditylenchus destructor TaxID=166010 RepID=A0AAD4MZY1_9BILA|nr:hypothetical protein DdX_09138 [Ditylenchus destructor]
MKGNETVRSPVTPGTSPHQMYDRFLSHVYIFVIHNPVDYDEKTTDQFQLTQKGFPCPLKTLPSGLNGLLSAADWKGLSPMSSIREWSGLPQPGFSGCDQAKRPFLQSFLPLYCEARDRAMLDCNGRDTPQRPSKGPPPTSNDGNE